MTDIAHCRTSLRLGRFDAAGGEDPGDSRQVGNGGMAYFALGHCHNPAIGAGRPPNVTPSPVQQLVRGGCVYQTAAQRHRLGDGPPDRAGGMTLNALRLAIVLFLGSFLASILTAEAQQARPVYRIGFLRNGPPPESFIGGFRQGLRELGYVDGQNISIEYGLADSAEQLPNAAAELVRRNVDVIIASGTPPAVSAKNATRTVPIIFVAAIDPVATGVAASLARPGGNVTGFALMSADLMGKRLELLTEVLPGLSRVAVLSQAINPGNTEYIGQAEIGGRALGLQVQVIAVHDPSDFERAFSEMRGAGAVVQLDDVLFTSHRSQMVELAARNQLPVMYALRDFVDVGGLIAYGADLPDQYRRAATYVDKILKGAKPADLPVQQPVKFDLVINLKTAKELGLTVPPSVLARADEVIE
jgi:putative ABC transport system substrate-binding protein